MAGFTLGGKGLGHLIDVFYAHAPADTKIGPIFNEMIADPHSTANGGRSHVFSLPRNHSNHRRYR
ncbi:truncated hemoglobin YjbI [Rhizobium paranaense]|uniref:Truncated hemoglobin YjbI n=1 Tax=Rhizobium paranaense TaxID=1650438 RepID=A0A7W8XSM0_9HYPH|nr:truncated hemoglobin YjbI [Rhizobium paranaense]